MMNKRKSNAVSQENRGAHPHARLILVKSFCFSKLQKMLENPKISDSESVDFFHRNVDYESVQKFGITNNAPHFVNMMPKNEK